MLLDLIQRPGTAFPPIRRPALVTAMRVMHVRYASLEPLSGFPNLRELSIIALPGPDLEFLRACPQLQYLRICHMPQVASLEPLEALERLVTLSLTVAPSAAPSRRWHRVASLSPIARLPALRHLDLLGVVPPERSLRPLEACPGLVTALFQGYPRSEEDRFHAKTGVVQRRTPPASFPEATNPSRPFPGAGRLRRLLIEGR
jgi:hypothetical protein